MDHRVSLSHQQLDDLEPTAQISPKNEGRRYILSQRRVRARFYDRNTRRYELVILHGLYEREMS